MIGALIGIIFVLIIAGVVWYDVMMLMAAIPIAEPFLTIIKALIILIAAIIVLMIIASILEAVGVHIDFPKLTKG